MKFLLISPKNRTVYNFRGDLVKTIIAKGYDVIVTGPDDTDVDKIEELGARFIVVPVNKNGTSILADLKYCFSLFKLIKKEKPKVTLGYTIKPVIYGSIAAKLAGVKNVNAMITGGGYVFLSHGIVSKIAKMLYKFGLKCADNVIFQNNDDYQEFVDRKLVKSSKCNVVNGSGVNLDKFQVADYPDDISFFMLSRFLKSKGVREYLKAARIVKEEYPNVKFYLLGKYEYEMQDAIPQSEIEEYINDGIVERFEETDDVRPYYAMCSVYVLPSYREGTPRTVLEAMAMGRAIITTDAPGCRETVRDGVNGFLVPVGDSESLAKMMLEFIDNPELISVFGNQSLRYVKEKFNVDIINQRMIEILNT
ncbi:MAG: glycosyltransferase family 4 protein [Eubacterium sp.]|nr:glycosyltransferase family 4 protein [Eubacterium sp.]